VHKVFAWLLVGAALVAGYSYYRNHPSQAKAQTTDQSQEAESKPNAQVSIQPMIVSPLQVLMDKAEGTLGAKEEPRQQWKAHPNDHIAPSPVGTSAAIVHKTFAITSSAKFLFEVPPHAVCRLPPRQSRRRGVLRRLVPRSGCKPRPPWHSGSAGAVLPGFPQQLQHPRQKGSSSRLPNRFLALCCPCEDSSAVASRSCGDGRIRPSSQAQQGDRQRPK
jgi:hypothetical protein